MPKKMQDFVQPVAPPTEAPQRSYKYMAMAFVAVAIILVIGIAYLVLAKAVITLTPANEPVTKSFYLTISENPETSTSTQPIIGGRIFSEKVTATEEYSVKEGTKKIEAPATGKVNIYNKREQAQTLVATTRLLSRDGVLFRLKEKVNVPANGSIEAEVYADKPGKDGEIAATTFTIPGLSAEIQKVIYAESTEAMKGGERQIGVLTQADIDQAISEFKKKQLEQMVAKQIAQLTEGSMVLVGGGVDTVDQKFSYDKKIGEEVSAFKLTGEITIMVAFADKQKILDTATSELKNADGNNGAEINADPASLKYDLEAINLDKKEVGAKIEIAGMVNFDPTKNIFDKNILVGFTEKDLQLYFSQFNAIKDARVEFSPFWVKKVPILKNHIEIKIQGK